MANSSSRDLELDIPNIESAVLDMANEDETGLYEVVWYLNSRYLAYRSEVLQQSAFAVVSNLVGKGWIYLFWCNRMAGTESAALSRSDALAAIGSA